MHDDDHDPECECRGTMRQVTEVFARQEAGIASDENLEDVEMAGVLAGRRWDEWAQDRRTDRGPEPSRAACDRWALYRAALNAVYPCPRCAPARFKRWRAGCYRSNHVAKTCRLCTPDRQEARR